MKNPVLFAKPIADIDEDMLRARLAVVDLPSLPTCGPWVAKPTKAHDVWFVMGTACNAFGFLFSESEAKALTAKCNEIRGYK